MNAPERITIADVQSRMDSRDLSIDAVGIAGVRYPVTVQARGWLTPTIHILDDSESVLGRKRHAHVALHRDPREAERSIGPATVPWRNFRCARNPALRGCRGFALTKVTGGYAESSARLLCLEIFELAHDARCRASHAKSRETTINSGKHLPRMT